MSKGEKKLTVGGECPCCHQKTSVPHGHPLSFDLERKALKTFDDGCFCNDEERLQLQIRRMLTGNV